VPSPVTVFTLADKFERGYIRSFNGAFQRELGHGFSAEAAYVGTRQIDQLGFRELNWSPIGGGNAGRQLNRQFGRTGQTKLIAPVGDSEYNSLQARLTRRFQNGYQFGVSYTLSKSEGVVSDSDNSLRINIPEYYDLNWATSSFDRTHNLHITGIYELPFGPGQRWLQTGVLGHIVGGWQLNTILSFYSGTPFGVSASSTSLNAPESNDQRADLVKDEVEILGGTGRGNSYFDPMAFKPVTEARFGTAPYNLLRGPGVAQWDLSVFRQLGLGHQFNLQIRFDAFNVTNRPRFSNPGSNVSNLQLNPDGTIRNLNGYTEITSTADDSERQMRLGIRLAW